MFKLITIFLCLLCFNVTAQVIPQYSDGYFFANRFVIYNYALYQARKSFHSTVTPNLNTNWLYIGLLPIHYVDKPVYVNKIINDPVCIAKKDSLQKRVSALEKQSGFIIKGDVIRIDTFKKTIRW